MSQRSGCKKQCWFLFLYFLMILAGLASGHRRCVEDALYVHPTDCAKFYICQVSRLLLMHCPPGLYFSPNSLTCVRPEIAQCRSNIGNRCPAYSDPTDCTRFYLCTPFGHILTPCPLGLHFSSRLRICVFPIFSNCPEPLTSGFGTQLASSNVVTATKKPLAATVAYPRVSNNEGRIISTGSITHFNDTSSIKNNVNATTLSNDKYNFTFSESSVTNTNLNIDVMLANIEEVSEIDTNTTTISSNEEYTINNGSISSSTEASGLINNSITSNSLAEKPANINISNDAIQSTLANNILTIFSQYFNNTITCKNNIWPHPTDCGKFYMASPAGYLELSCPRNLLFNPVLLVCDLAANALCTTITNHTSNSDGESDDKSSEIASEFIPVKDEFIATTAEPTTKEKTEIASMELTTTITQNANELTTVEGDFESTTTKPNTQEKTEVASMELITIADKITQNANECTTTEERVGIASMELTTTADKTTQNSNEFTKVEGDLTSTTTEAKAQKTTNFASVELTTLIYQEDDNNISPVPEQSPDRIELVVTETIKEQETSTIEPNCTITREIIEPICKSSIWPNPTDCTRFFLCGASGPVEMVCPGGTNFNPILLVCDWPENVQCFDNSGNENISEFTSELSQGTDKYSEITVSTTPSQGTTVVQLSDYPSQEIINNTKLCQAIIWPHPTDCTRFFICKPSGTLEMVCPEGVIFNPSLLVCDWPENVECVHNSGNENLSEFSSSELSQGTEKYNETTVSTTRSQGTTLVQLSDEPGQEIINNTKLCQGSIWPHPTDCSKFFLCGPLGPVETVCPEGTNFSPILLICDWPENVECFQNSGNENVSEVTSNGSSELSQGTDEYTEITVSTTLSEETTVDKLSDHPGQEITNNSKLCQGSIWPHPTDCSKFFLCGPLGPVETICPEGANFNRILLVCDWPENVECFHNSGNKNLSEVTGNSISELSQGTEEYNETTVSITRSQGTTLVQLSDEPGQEIINNPKLCQGSIWPHSTDCSKFFLCGPLGPVETVCPEGTNFNPILLICDWPENVECFHNSGNENCISEVTSNSSSELSQGTDEYTEITVSTTLSEETTVDKLADHQGEEITNNSKLCEGSIWPHPTDCSKFFLCGPLGPVETVCPEGANFNPILLICDWPENVECFHNSVNENVSEFTSNNRPELSRNADKYSKTTVSAKTSQGTRKVQLSDYLVEEISDNANLCQGSIWPHPDDCGKYFVCGPTGPVEMICSDELYFNPVYLVCDWPDSVECSKESPVAA